MMLRIIISRLHAYELRWRWKIIIEVLRNMVIFKYG